MPKRINNRITLVFQTVSRFVRGIVIALLVMMMVIILLSAVELAWILIRELFRPPWGLLNINEILDIFGLFFMILIGLGLLDTIKSYLAEDLLHVETVFLVAMVAVARKLIILEIKSLAPSTLIGIAALILALAGGYCIVKFAYRNYSVK